MTFEQNDIQRLVDEIIGLLERYRNDPGALDAISCDLSTMYK